MLRLARQELEIEYGRIMRHCQPKGADNGLGLPKPLRQFSTLLIEGFQEQLGSFRREQEGVTAAMKALPPPGPPLPLT
jgi:hypothetical protein